MDERMNRLIDAARQLKRGNYRVDVPVTPLDEVGYLGLALRELADALEVRYQELQKLNQITARINSGLLLDQILEEVYRDFQDLIPYNRIGFSLLEENGSLLRAVWARSDREVIHLGVGYTAPMAGSSLQAVLQTRRPRILNDLETYLADHPASESTRLIVKEGYRSSLTCPLIANGVAVGFMFFSSVKTGAYADVHVEVFQQIAEQLSVIVEKGRLVSELSEKNAQIERQNEELRRLDELKNRFLGMAAHDLRNPIADIQLVSDLMLSTEGAPMTEEEQRDFLSDINQQARYMSELLNDILSVAEIESGQLRLLPQSIDVETFVKEAIRRHSKLSTAKGTRIVLVGVNAGEMKADPHRLRQVIDNLLSNAVKFSPPGSTVRVRARYIGDAWRIEVADEGPGINEKDRVRLFQDFARLSARPTGGEKSTGLGLAISRRVVEAHGGKIGVDSEPGHGATFWFTIP